MAVERADTLADGWRLRLDWQRAVAPDNQTESKTLEADRGYIRVTARRRGEAELEDLLPARHPVLVTRRVHAHAAAPWGEPVPRCIGSSRASV